ncbi:MAG TPA: septum formation protein Maf [Gammaproteobacteria bacterium]|nr:septum formation protein Maf [Gammaproteobacteria bacterium]|tara:strand:- start:207 stop:791 length:585 start_codon:yes stop_codon:yes gene_type:complete
MKRLAFVLASASPRRRELLSGIGLAFDIDKPDIEESPFRGETASDYVRRLAGEKARTVLQRQSNRLILAADTTVVIDGDILEKPNSKDEGVEMLQRLSGTRHQVMTGVSIINDDRESSFVSTSYVIFRALAEDEILWYWNTGEPRDKAGGYGLQGAGGAFIEAINGSYSNVIGLPLAETVSLLRSFGVKVMQNS